MVAGVQNLVRDLVLLQEFGQNLGFLDGGGADEGRLTALACILDEPDDRAIFLLRGAINLVVLVIADHGHVGRHLDDVEAVDVHELVGLGEGGTGHAGELLVKAEVVLEGNRGEGLVLGLDGDMLLGLERLMQAFGIAPAGHHAAGELIDNDDLIILHDVIAVALEERVRTQRLLHMVHDGHVLDVVEGLALEQAGLAQKLLDMLVAGLGEGDDAGLLVDLVILLDELRDDDIDGTVEIGAVVDGAGDDERGARLVDEDGVHLVDDGVEMPALHHVGGGIFHVVAEIVEAELVVGAVGHVGGVLRAALVVGEVMHDAADGEAEKLIDLAHPAGVALGEVVVDGDDMNAASGERVEIDGERGDERLAFAGLHLGDLAVMQNHAAHELDVEMALAERALCGFAYGREGFGQEVVEGLAVLEALAEDLGAGAELGIGECLELGLERVDGVNPDGIFF